MRDFRQVVFSSSNEPSYRLNDRDSGFTLRFFRIKGQSLKHSKENFLDKAISLKVQGNIPRLSQHLNVPNVKVIPSYFAFLSMGGSRG